MKVCKNCGSSKVFYDAYVSVNDPKDVLTFDAIMCDDCGRETSLVEAATESTTSHDGHVLKYVMFKANIEQDALITPEGNVEVNGDISILDFGDDHKVYCDTCEKFVNAGEDGLGEHWEVR